MPKKTLKQLIEHHEQAATYAESKSAEWAAKARISREKAERLKREAAEAAS